MKNPKKIAGSFNFAIKGIIHAYKTDGSFRTEILLGFPIYVGICFLLWPMTQTEILFLTLSCVFILSIELVNTSFEKMLDKIHPEKHESIGRSKDISAAAVLVAVLFAVLVVVVMTVSRIVH